MSEIDLTDKTFDLSELIIKENRDKTGCYIKHIKNDNYISTFILSSNRDTEIITEVSFYINKETEKYIPRLTFKKRDSKTKKTLKEIKNNIAISFDKSESASVFWRLINYLQKFNQLIETDKFNQQTIISDNDFILSFNKKDSSDKTKIIKELINNINLDTSYLESLVFKSRETTIKRFYKLLKNIKVNNSILSREYYREINHIKTQGDEIIWHHFLKGNKWIIGLNTNLIFPSIIIDEAKTGVEATDGKNSPKVDILAISNFTSLIELKTSKTKIFKDTKTSLSRSNTWDLSNDFIEGISQCLAQKNSLMSSYLQKNIIHNGSMLNKDKYRTCDPKSIFIIGNRNEEFPHNDIVTNLTKSDVFESFRRNNRNIDIITYDELFERAYFSVFDRPTPTGWYDSESFEKEMK